MAKLFGSWQARSGSVLRFAGVEADLVSVDDARYSVALCEPAKQPDGVVCYQSRVEEVMPALANSPLPLVVVDDRWSVEFYAPTLGDSRMCSIYKNDDRACQISWPSSGLEDSSEAALAMASVLQIAARMAAEIDKAAGR